jgi:hypothetical protein
MGKSVERRAGRLMNVRLVVKGIANMGLIVDERRGCQ